MRGVNQGGKMAMSICNVNLQAPGALIRRDMVCTYGPCTFFYSDHVKLATTLIAIITDY